MRIKLFVIALAAVALALPLAAQMGMGSRIPTLSGIWHPVVGSGANYEITQEPGDKKDSLEFTVVGKEDIGGKTGYWIESSISDPKGQGEIVVKVLESVDGNTVTNTRMVMQMPGRPPMEMESGMMGMGGRQPSQTTVADFRDKAEHVGSESVTVPAGTFTCEHYRMKDGSGEAWISDKVAPWSLVKSRDEHRTIVLAKVITDAKDRITGTPVKFDPMEMMRNRQGQ